MVDANSTPDLGTLAMLPLELRSQILIHTLDIKVVIKKDGSEGDMSGRQHLPPALEKDLESMGGIPIESCTYIIRSPAAFHAFMGRLSSHNRRRVRSLRLVLLASLNRHLYNFGDPTFNTLMDPGWRSVFKALPNTISFIVFDVTFCPVRRWHAQGDTGYVTRWLPKFSTLMYIKSKGNCRFGVVGCELPVSQDNFEKATLNVVRKNPKGLRAYNEAFESEKALQRGVPSPESPFW
ncbi:MAG: hypothetical protein M1812_005114 [Candelaria pacifica]|nr:MAG: hypothetical protein M1812_005114 [Candelaria pacifica]